MQDPMLNANDESNLYFEKTETNQNPFLIFRSAGFSR
ncbi:hypothetical protein CLV44_10332 [Marinobacterium halophilum]|uniref:Uncharacterized protein n=1 Tax=Marinobacterium halophilum TaxID=267374 RepID=A0A2P8F205_9GAMM|nr:hypothetical protein CLV44_10332 [Marinobacterium halophilum]